VSAWTASAGPRNRDLPGTGWAGARNGACRERCRPAGPGTGTGGAAAVTGTAITGPAASEAMLDSAWPPSW